MPDHNRTLNEALTYFNRSPILRRMLQQFAQKYRSLGRIGGSVRLQILTPQERESLCGLLGKDLSRQNSVTVSTAQLTQALQQTRFAGLTLQEIIFAFMGGPVLTRAEEIDRSESDKEQFFSQLDRECESNAGRAWLEHIINKGQGTRGIHLAYQRDKNRLQQWLKNVLSALRQLPANGFERLPVFAARITGDPHSFDPAAEQGRLLIEALRFLHLEVEETERRPLTSEEISELLAAFGILRDDIFSFVTCTGLLAFSKKSRELSTWRSAYVEGVVLNVPLREVVKIDTLLPALPAGLTETPKAVFVVENPGVFSKIVDVFAGRPHPPLICTHGQFRLAALLLLDKLAQSGIHIYYSGDFDPEGLQMAQRLLQRYPRIAKAWRCTLDDYTSCTPTQPLNTARLNKLKRINHPGLVAVRDAIFSTGKAGYQEQIISPLLADLKRHF